MDRPIRRAERTGSGRALLADQRDRGERGARPRGRAARGSDLGADRRPRRAGDARVRPVARRRGHARHERPARGRALLGGTAGARRQALGDGLRTTGGPPRFRSRIRYDLRDRVASASEARNARARHRVDGEGRSGRDPDRSRAACSSRRRCQSGVDVAVRTGWPHRCQGRTRDRARNRRNSARHDFQRWARRDRAPRSHDRSGPRSRGRRGDRARLRRYGRSTLCAPAQPGRRGPTTAAAGPRVSGAGWRRADAPATRRSDDRWAYRGIPAR